MKKNMEKLYDELKNLPSEHFLIKNKSFTIEFQPIRSHCIHVLFVFLRSGNTINVKQTRSV